MMKHILSLSLFAALVWPTSHHAQTQVDLKKYPDYHATSARPDAKLLRYGSRNTKGVPTPVSERPPYVNNATAKHFPPIFNQAGGSCGSASRIGYMFAHEINSFRDADGSKMENQYPTHFVWLLTNGNSGKDEFVQHIGVPSAKTYGGQTYSNLFGYQVETNNYFGWMTGYNKWFEAMHNRMLRPTRLPISVQSKEGREALKNYLWNHNGDSDFKSGGVVGIGVAADGDWRRIPKTDRNNELGVSNMYYVQDWGPQVNHALTIVGYDDRIEFDLDGNGVAGEVDKDEVGAWIVANSWGNWCNSGFIYCPYARAVPTRNRDANGNVQGWWEPEIYTVRKNYRPLRTIKVKMDYSHRSEIKLSVGIAANLKANRPEKTIELHHFRFAGDGGNGDVSPAPEMPMLGQWADGELHKEAMEFGYDLTDLTAGYDVSQPLKYFFIIDSRTKSGNASRAIGSGNIHHLGILDYEFDVNGIETHFNLGETGKTAVPKGKLTTLSTIVYGEQYTLPQNLVLSGNLLSWQAPQPTGHTVTNYNVYADGKLVGTTLEKKMTVPAAGSYSVSAVYETGLETKTVSVSGSVAPQTENVAINLKGNGFIIPDIFKDQHPAATIEFWVKPNRLENWNQEIGPGWGSFMAHANANGTFTAGWNTGSNRIDSYNALKVGQWSHIAMAFNKGNLRVHVNGGAASTITTTAHSGLGGFGDLVFNGSASANRNHDATYDEIRIWDVARTATNIIGSTNTEFAGQLMPQGLLAYYKGDVIMIDGKPYLRDCVGGHHAPIIQTSAGSYEQVANDKKFTLASGNFYTSNTKISSPAQIVAGQPALFEAMYPDFAESVVWNAPEAGIENLKTPKASITFPNAGSYTVTLTASNAAGDKTITVSKQVTVVAAPAPNAEFTASSLAVPAGERVSFSPVEPTPGFVYRWEMPGGTVTTSNAITAGTSYDHFGKYNVTLTVTAPNGTKATKTIEVNVMEVTPEADFNLSEGVLLKGQSTTLQDASKYGPTSWQWIFSSAGQVYTTTGASPKVDINVPGVYDVILTVKNGAGANSKKLPRGLIVVNADSKNGLSFNGAAAHVTTERVPIEKGAQDVTIEWWANPAKLSDYCCGIGDADGRFFMKVNANGELLVNRGGTNVFRSGNNCVIAGEWHHYAVTIKRSAINIYRDGKLFKRGSISGISFPELAQFTIGSSAAEMSGQIDEFRIWGTALTEEKIRAYANAPIANVHDEAVQADALLLYYDFNQNSGAVEDRSTRANNGVRSGFGPEGDAWALSKGVFCLNFDVTGQNVTKDYLKNYKKAFYFNNKQVNNATPNRWYELRDWTLENAITSADGKVVTGAHVDKEKEVSFTIATGWDGFSNLIDHKVYQTITLPAGAYTFSTTYHDNANLGKSDASQSYLVVSRGQGLPNTADLGLGALAGVQMEHTGASAVNSVSFVLTEETEVSLGLVVNMRGQSIAIIKEFSLVRSELGALTGVDGVVVDAKHLGSEAIYDLSGRRVFQPQSGQIYIQGGQRILVK